MFLVEDRQATLAWDAIRILSTDLIGAEGAQPAAVVDRLRVGIAEQEGKAAGHAPREFSGERVIVGVHNTNVLHGIVEVRPGFAAELCAWSGRSSVEIHKSLQVMALRSQVTDFEGSI